MEMELDHAVCLGVYDESCVPGDHKAAITEGHVPSETVRFPVNRRSGAEAIGEGPLSFIGVFSGTKEFCLEDYRHCYVADCQISGEKETVARRNLNAGAFEKDSRKFPDIKKIGTLQMGIALGDTCPQALCIHLHLDRRGRDIVGIKLNTPDKAVKLTVNVRHHEMADVKGSYCVIGIDNQVCH
jgi:hypothetical protein